MNRKNLLPVMLVPTCILMLPAAAMLFKVEGWAWDVADFIVFWILIASVMLTYKLVTRKASGAYRLAAGLSLTAGLALIWVNGAVGLIGSEDNPANVMYAGVLAIGVIGAVIARLEPPGMAWTLFVVTFAQLLVPLVALMAWPGDFSPGVVPVFGLNGVFVLVFAVSGLLFWHAGRRPCDADTEVTA